MGNANVRAFKDSGNKGFEINRAASFSVSTIIFSALSIASNFLLMTLKSFWLKA